MNVGITGARGFVGKALSAHLQRLGHTIRAIDTRGGVDPNALTGCDAVVNLAGEPVAQRWTDEARKKIESSRVEGTRALVNAMQTHRPQVLVSASAVGYYGNRGDDVLKESEPPSQDFLGRVALEWEREARAAETFGVRVARLRLGVVLGPGGGALQKMLPPFRIGLGGPIGGGAQWMPWIDMQDLTSLIVYLLNESTVRGAFNAVSPNPETNTTFTQALGKALHRPALIPLPGFALKLMFGEMSQIMLGSQRAIPDAAIRAGFTFAHPDIFGTLARAVR